MRGWIRDLQEYRLGTSCFCLCLARYFMQHCCMVLVTVNTVRSALPRSAFYAKLGW